MVCNSECKWSFCPPTARAMYKPTGQVGEKKKTIWIFINKAFAVPGYDAERKSMFFHQMWFYLARINSYDRISVLYLLMSSLALTFWEKLPEIGRRSSKKFYFFSFLFKLQLDI